MTRVLVTGLPRTGTEYVAELLRSCGREAHHEQVFTPEGVAINQWTGVEVSWMGAPYCSSEWLREDTVIHLTRDPQAVFRSLMHNGFAWFEHADGMMFWRRFILHHAPEVAWPTDWCERLAGFIEAWNSFLDGVQIVHVEDPAGLARALDLDEEEVKKAAAELGSEIGHRTQAPPVALSPEVATRLAAVAGAWGYQADPA